MHFLHVEGLEKRDANTHVFPKKRQLLSRSAPIVKTYS